MNSRTPIVVVWIALLSFGGLGAMATAAAFAKQSLIEDALSATKGYF